MADYRAKARRAAARYGLDPNVFVRQIQQESGFNPSARSPAGAEGIAQITPATARGWGVDPMDPDAALNAAAKNMASYVKQYGGYENALRAYNAGPGAIERSKGFAETNNYVRTILGGRDPGKLARPGGGTRSTPSQMDNVPEAAPVEAAPVASAINTLADLRLPQRAQVQVSAPSAPVFAAQAPTPAAYQTPVTGWQPRERFDQGSIVEALQAVQQAKATTPVAAAALSAEAATPRAGTRAGTRAATPSSGTGKFKIVGPQPGRLKPELTSFAKKVANVFGGTLAGSDGSSHSKYTVNGNVSEHYSGNATDIFTINGQPATGARLIAAGRAALEAAGMPRSKARKAPGGLYNVGNHQIIFGVSGVQNGGDHTDHLHISTHAR